MSIDYLRTHSDLLSLAANPDCDPGIICDWLAEHGAGIHEVLALYAGSPPDYTGDVSQAVLAAWCRATEPDSGRWHLIRMQRPHNHTGQWVALDKVATDRNVRIDLKRRVLRLFPEVQWQRQCLGCVNGDSIVTYGKKCVNCGGTGVVVLNPSQALLPPEQPTYGPSPLREVARLMAFHEAIDTASQESFRREAIPSGEPAIAGKGGHVSVNGERLADVTSWTMRPAPMPPSDRPVGTEASTLRARRAAKLLTGGLRKRTVPERK